MGTNKYGLDFVLWGSVPKPVKSSPPPSSPAKKTEQKKKEREHCEEISNDNGILQHSINLYNPKFLPDHSTAMNKKCTLSVDIKTSQKQGIVAIQLYGIYKGIHYPLGQKDIHFESNKLTTSICLESVSDYADDVNKVTADPTLYVDYYFKAESRNAESVTSNTLRLPYLDTKIEHMQKCAARMASSSKSGCNGTVITSKECARPHLDDHTINSEEKKSHMHNSAIVAKAASNRTPTVKIAEPVTTESKKSGSDCRCIRNTTKDNTVLFSSNDKKSQQKKVSSVTNAAVKKSPVVSMTPGNKILCGKHIQGY